MFTCSARDVSAFALLTVRAVCDWSRRQPSRRKPAAHLWQQDAVATTTKSGKVSSGEAVGRESCPDARPGGAAMPRTQPLRRAVPCVSGLLKRGEPPGARRSCDHCSCAILRCTLSARWLATLISSCPTRWRFRSAVVPVCPCRLLSFASPQSSFQPRLLLGSNLGPNSR